MGSIEAFIFAGFVAGLAIGWLAPTSKPGCFVVLGVPILALCYVTWRSTGHPEIRAEQSTWALVYFFGPLWPSIGALVGFYLVRAMREWSRKH